MHRHPLDMMHNYTLDENRQPHPCPIDAYRAWHESMPPASDWYSGKTRLGFTVAREPVGSDEVSTVYLGNDHGFGLNGDNGPILWETMVFPACDVCERYRTYDEAIAGHRRIVESMREAK
jgi:hypothetical protein